MDSQLKEDGGRPQKRAILYLAVGLMISILLGVYAVICVHKQLSSGNDFPIYYRAANEMISGRFHYEVDTGLHGYVYLPFFAIVLSPLTLLSLKTAAIIWYTTNFLVWGLSIFLVAKIHRRHFPRANRTWPIVLALFITAQFFLFNLDLGQTNIIILAVTLLALELFFGSRKRVLPGILIALTSAIKPFAALLVIPFFLRSQWRLFAGFVFGLFASVVLLPGILLGPNPSRVLLSDWYAKVMMPQQKGYLQGSKIIDQSPAAALRRLIVDGPAFADKRVNLVGVSQQRFALYSRILQGFLFGSMLLCWAAGRRKNSDRSLLIDLTCGYCGMVLIFGFSLRAQFVVLFLPWVLLLTLAIQNRPLKCLPLNLPNTLLFVAALLIGMANPGLIGRAASNWALAYSAITIGTIVITGILIWVQLGRGSE